jgi:hypothetical protein
LWSAAGALSAEDQREAYVNACQKVVKAAYPELRGERAQVTLFIDTTYDRDWVHTNPVGVDVRPLGQLYVASHTRDDQVNQYLGGHVNVSPVDGRIESAAFDGRYVHSRDLMILEQEIRSHFSWADSDVETAIEQAGGLYGPVERDRFLRDVDVHRFTEVLGAFDVLNIEFEWRPVDGRKDPNGGDIRPPRWMATVAAQPVNGQRECYRIAFEPFNGRFTGLSRTFCQ